MIRRALIAALLSAVLLGSAPAPLHASPDAPMCVADQPYVSRAPIDLVQWHMPMCGPFLTAVPIAEADPPEERAIAAYRRATDAIAAANYEEARLQLDLARRGLGRIHDRIALQSGRLELLRQQPERAAEFFSEASRSPHESVRVEASFGHVFALLRADDPIADAALEELLESYPQVPNRTEILFEHAQSLLRQGRYEEAISVMHMLRVEHPGSRSARWADGEIQRLQRLGHEVTPWSDDDRVRRAWHLVQTGPLDEAKRAVEELLESPLTGEQHAEVHYLAGKLARFEGRWEAAETYMRTAQLFPMPSLSTARTIENRANDMAQTASARDRGDALRRLSELRAGRRDFSIPSARLVEMIEVAAAAELRNEVDSLVSTLGRRKGLSTGILLDAAMAALGAGSETIIVPLLDEIARQPYSRHRAAAFYHLARVHERAGHQQEAELFFSQSKKVAESMHDDYYALWATNGLERLIDGDIEHPQEGFEDPYEEQVPAPPRGSDDALADRLEPIAALHTGGYPWIARAVDLLRIGERDAATEELFETYLQWRHAQGRPIARAGLDCVARADGRINPPIASDVRETRLDLSEDERATLSTVAAALGDIGTAGGFAGSELIETLPRAYEWLVVPAAKRYGLDPNLLLAVMRVESAYQKHIVSYAGAVGLMQIMPRTGQLIAHALGHDDFTPADLLDPRVNLDFAAWYLASLLQRFDGHLPLAIAAYNGGPHNVRRWIQESAPGTPLDVLLERIPFIQTHRYVRKVLVNYQAYREQRDLPMPRLSVVLPDPRVDPLAF
ncbi:MAG: transglycosylase SLT domain-containing protein [Polyangiales bacterium]